MNAIRRINTLVQTLTAALGVLLLCISLVFAELGEPGLSFMMLALSIGAAAVFILRPMTDSDEVR